jgi:flavin-dependent dehydrogenase
MGGRRFRCDHAVIIGGSMAGLLAARVLADHFARVTIVERDEFPDVPRSRPGTPHDGHFHALMAAGLAAIERLLPGFEADLAAAGAVPGDASLDAAYLLPTGWAPRYRSGLYMRASSRRLAEWTLRRHVLARDTIALAQATRVTGLVADAASAVRGVRVRDGAAEREIAADLVVDASGRTSRAPEFLKALGYGRPEEVVVDSRLAYASRRFERPSGDPGWKALLVVADPPDNPRYGGIYPEEGGRWVVALAGPAGDAPPSDPDGFLAFARSLRSPLLAEAIARARPIEPVFSYGSNASRIRNYQRMRRLPEGFIVLGDAVAALNPIYGQGMTLAALGAEALGEELAERGASPGLARRFQRRLAKIIRIPFMLAASEDSRFCTDAPLLARLVRTYTDRLRTRTPTDRAVADAFFRTLQLTDPAAFLRPSILARALAPRIASGRDAMAEAVVPAIVKSDE